MEQEESSQALPGQFLIGLEVVDMEGATVGHIERVHGHSSHGSDWAAVSTGLVDKKLIAVPLADATIDEKVKVPYPKELVQDAPEITGSELQEAVEMDAYRHYNLRRELAEDFQQHADLSDPPPDPAVNDNVVGERAYAIYEERGSVHGQDKEDWHSAEQELRGRDTNPRPQ